MTRSRVATICLIGSWLALPAWLLLAALAMRGSAWSPFALPVAGPILLMTAFGIALMLAVVLAVSGGALWGIDTLLALRWRIVGLLLGIGSALAAFPVAEWALRALAAAG